MVLIALTLGCQQDMARQGKYKPLQESSFFDDQRSARPLPPDTVARGQLRTDTAYYAGKSGDDYVNTFPFEITEEKLARGRERFNIFCAVCHDRLGTGQGKIVERGFTRPPSYHTDLSRGYKLRGKEILLRDVPVGYLYNVITNGFGAMPDYSEQVPPDDRWAVVAYVRALQLSQHLQLKDLPPEQQQKIRAALGGQP